MSQGEIHGLRIRVDGDVEALPTIGDADAAIDGMNDVRSMRVNGQPDLLMFASEPANGTAPVNLAATQLQGNGWPVNGDSIVTDILGRPLPDHITARYLEPEPREPAVNNPAAGLAARALEWEDRHDAVDHNYGGDGPVDDIGLGIEVAADPAAVEPAGLDL